MIRIIALILALVVAGVAAAGPDDPVQVTITVTLSAAQYDALDAEAAELGITPSALLAQRFQLDAQSYAHGTLTRIIADEVNMEEQPGHQGAKPAVQAARQAAQREKARHQP